MLLQFIDNATPVSTTTIDTKTEEGKLLLIALGFISGDALPNPPDKILGAIKQMHAENPELKVDDKTAFEMLNDGTIKEVQYASIQDFLDAENK